MANFCSQCGEPLVPGAEFCTSCGHSVGGRVAAHPNVHQKREKILGSPPRRKRTGMYLVLASAAAVAIYVYSILPAPGNRLLRAQPIVAPGASYPASGQQMSEIPVQVVDDRISVPLDVVLQRKFVAFTYRDSRNSVPMLAYVSSGGKIVTAVSICEPCNSQRFHIRGEELICNACGTTWDLNTMEPLRGSCGKYPPDVLPNTVVGNEIRIDAQTVAAWQRRA